MILHWLPWIYIYIYTHIIHLNYISKSTLKGDQTATVGHRWDGEGSQHHLQVSLDLLLTKYILLHTIRYINIHKLYIIHNISPPATTNSLKQPSLSSPLIIQWDNINYNLISKYVESNVKQSSLTIVISTFFFIKIYQVKYSGHLPHPLPAPAGHCHICRKCKNILVSIKIEKKIKTLLMIFFDDVWPKEQISFLVFSLFCFCSSISTTTTNSSWFPLSDVVTSMTRKADFLLFYDSFCLFYNYFFLFSISNFQVW